MEDELLVVDELEDELLIIDELEDWLLPPPLTVRLVNVGK